MPRVCGGLAAIRFYSAAEVLENVEQRARDRGERENGDYADEDV
jgi:hypothetical protein